MQKALFLESKFGQFVVGERPVDKPGPGEVLIKVHSAGLNPVDWKVQKSGVLVEEYPVVLGCDIAGDIEEVGKGVMSFQLGDRVFCKSINFSSKWGGYQQYTIAIARFVSKIPEGSSYDEVASIPLALAAAYGGLYKENPHGLAITPPSSDKDAPERYPNEPFLVLGGSSAVGQMAIQLAKISGFSPILVTASLHNSDDLQALGATHVLDRQLTFDHLSAQVKNVLGDRPLMYAFDAMGLPDTHKTGVDLLAPGGQLVSVFPPHASSEPLPDNKRINAHGVSMTSGDMLDLYEHLFCDLVTGWIAEGKVKPNRIQVLPNGLEGVREGLKRLEANAVSRAKLVVRPQETQ